MMFPHPHGRTLLISRIDLKIIEANVKIAARIPTYPIFPAITSNFFCKSVSSLGSELFEMAPAEVLIPTDVTTALPLPLTQRDFARRTPLFSPN